MKDDPEATLGDKMPDKQTPPRDDSSMSDEPPSLVCMKFKSEAGISCNNTSSFGSRDSTYDGDSYDQPLKKIKLEQMDEVGDDAHTIKLEPKHSRKSRRRRNGRHFNCADDKECLLDHSAVRRIKVEPTGNEGDHDAELDTEEQNGDSAVCVKKIKTEEDRQLLKASSTENYEVLHRSVSDNNNPCEFLVFDVSTESSSFETSKDPGSSKENIDWDTDSGDQYLNKRAKNNEAARKCRANKKRRHEELTKRLAELEQENKLLKLELAMLLNLKRASDTLNR